MMRVHDDLQAIFGGAGPALPPQLHPLRHRLEPAVPRMRDESCIGKERGRAEREHVYAGMYARCGETMRVPASALDLAAGLATGADATDAVLTIPLCRRLGSDSPPSPATRAVADTRAHFVQRLRATSTCTTRCRTRAATAHAD